MSISIFQPPPLPMNERERERAVVASGALEAQDDPVLLAVARDVCHRMGVSASLLSILLHDTQYVVAAHGIAARAYRRKHSFSGHAIASGEDFFFVPDLLSDQRFADNPWVNRDAGQFRFYAAAVLRWDGNHAIGAISAVDPQPRAEITEHDRTTMADAAAAIVARLHERRDAPRHPEVQITPRG
jgi:GAF domain-containing protein